MNALRSSASQPGRDLPRLLAAFFWSGPPTSLAPSPVPGRSRGANRGGAIVRARGFIEVHEARGRPLKRTAAVAWCDANVSGKDEDFAARKASRNRLYAA